MKTLLESMKFGNCAMVKDFDTLNENTPVSGFTFRPNASNTRANQIIADDGEVFTAEIGICFRCGNELHALLYTDPENNDGTRFFLGDLYPDNNLVIATSDSRLVYFAPICNSKMELLDFLTKINKFFRENKGTFPWYVHDSFIDLALWLYKHNPGKKVETSWGI